MDEHFIKIHKWLYPVSWIYGAVVTVRNKLFDWGFLRSKSFDVPVICIGNLSVGGTGKTPHTEYLIKLLRNSYHVAVLSRGYKRHSRGYVLATSQSTAHSIGDEPYQMYTKFPSVTLAVDENRCHGIEQLLAIKEPSVEVVLLDDAFTASSATILYFRQVVYANLSTVKTGHKSLLSQSVRKTLSLSTIILSRND